MIPLKAIPFHNVQITEPFWKRRQSVNIKHSLQKQYEMCEQTGRLEALRLRELPDGAKSHIFWDSDTAKWLEAACDACRIQPDEVLRAQIDHVASLFCGAQLPDGYLNSYFSLYDTERRWKNLRANHELYCAGHIFEAAVSHYGLTGSDELLSVACRYADYIDSVFGRSEGKMSGYSGHEEIELALVRLYRTTGTRRYLDLASFFVEERGKAPLYFNLEREGVPSSPWDVRPSYFQAHLPVREQKEAEGHAVRAMYLYCAMADLAEETEDGSLLDACKQIWDDMAGTKLYVTGGIGSFWEQESFSRQFFLPNDRAYCETCATVGLIFWSHRMLRLTGESHYADVMERCLYNAALAGMSLDGKSFFYQNPLSSVGKHHRQEWFDCCCCPSNLSRLVATLGGYVYSEAEDYLYVHLYIGSEATFQHGSIRQSGSMPWQGDVRFEFQLTHESVFGLQLRVPSWTEKIEVTINDEPVTSQNSNDWIRIERSWKSGDVVDVHFSMSVCRVYSDPRVVGNSGQVALQRGPFVYCIEDADYARSALNVSLPRDNELGGILTDEEFGEELYVLEGTACECCNHSDKVGLYSINTVSEQVQVPFRAIPYFAWDNRQPGAMRVWIPEAHGSTQRHR